MKVIVLDSIGSNERASSPQASLAMDCHCSWFFLGNADKLTQNGFGRTSPVRKIEFIVPDSPFFKLILIVSFIVESDNGVNTHFLEDRDVVFGGE